MDGSEGALSQRGEMESVCGEGIFPQIIPGKFQVGQDEATTLDVSYISRGGNSFSDSNMRSHIK